MISMHNMLQVPQQPLLTHKNLLAPESRVEANGVSATLYESFHTSLHELMAAKSLNFSEILSVSMSIMEAVSYLHSNAIIHRSLHSHHVLMKDQTVKLIGMSNSKKLSAATGLTATVLTAPLWRAPEILQGNYGLPVDIWGAGCIFYELAHKGMPLFVGLNAQERLRKWSRADLEFAPIFEAAHPRYCYLIRKMVQTNATNRPSAAEVVAELAAM
jgi:serine/threonine protein kinase